VLVIKLIVAIIIDYLFSTLSGSALGPTQPPS